MNFLHWEFQAGPGNVIQIDLDTAANVQLMDDSNFAAFRRGSSYHYQGGYYKRTPVRLTPSQTKNWHVVIHLGGYAGTVRASASIV